MGSRFAIKMHTASARDGRRRRNCDEVWVEGCVHMDKPLRKYAIFPAERVASAFKIRLFCAWQVERLEYDANRTNGLELYSKRVFFCLLVQGAPLRQKDLTTGKLVVAVCFALGGESGSTLEFAIGHRGRCSIPTIESPTQFIPHNEHVSRNRAMSRLFGFKRFSKRTSKDRWQQN